MKLLGGGLAESVLPTPQGTDCSARAYAVILPVRSGDTGGAGLRRSRPQPPAGLVELRGAAKLNWADGEERLSGEGNEYEHKVRVA